MDYERMYTNAREKLLIDKTICKENRDLFKKFLDYEEYKLKRRNGINKLDDNSYKTCLSYVSRFRVVDRWFKGKAWVKLTKEDIKKVYDDLEDGKIKTKRGNKPLKDKRTYYNLIFRSKPFEMAGKSEFVNEVMEFYTPTSKGDVRYITEETFRKLVDLIKMPEHKVLMWLCWDIGENCNSLLKLRKKDCVRQINADSKAIEYNINLRKEILKRQRKARTEPTNYVETANYLDLILKDKEENDNLFGFEVRNAKKFLDKAVKKLGAKCLPNGENVTLKDLRSSMACDLLNKGWTRDEINARLGHSPSSKEIDRYINFLAIDRNKPKKKVYEDTISKLRSEVEQVTGREKLLLLRFDDSKKEFVTLKERMKELEKKRESSDELINELTGNPETLKMIAHAIAKLGLVGKVQSL
ncbi:MAG: hypothetical protein WC980_07875 [Candidatus Brocadiia bacterium]